MTSELEVEATGETVGEAKWSALRELERRFPGLDRDAVDLVVVSEGERGLLGVGQVPARVVARLAEAPSPAPLTAAATVVSTATLDDSASAARLRALLERVCTALGVSASVTIDEDDQSINANLVGPDLGLVIGKRGQTIDAVQYLANAILHRTDETRPTTVDAAGYRARRQATLERAAERAAERALATGSPVALEPMSAVERKIVHVHLGDRPELETTSDGAEPNRFVVVSPSGGE